MKDVVVSTIRMPTSQQRVVDCWTASRDRSSGERTRKPVHAADEFDELQAAELIEEQRVIGHDTDFPPDLHGLVRHFVAENADRAGGVFSKGAQA